MTEIHTILKDARTIAVVGLSAHAARTSHKIADYLKKAGYRIVPVNPHHDVLLDEKSYPSVDAIPDEIEVDIVDVFRKPQFMADVVRDVIKRKERTGRRPVIWSQIGVSSEEAEQLARANDLPYVRNRCTLVEHSLLPA